jgi:hypothetical protein
MIEEMAKVVRGLEWQVGTLNGNVSNQTEGAKAMGNESR